MDNKKGQTENTEQNGADPAQKPGEDNSKLNKPEDPEAKKLTLVSFKKNSSGYIDMEFKVKEEFYEEIKNTKFYVFTDWNKNDGTGIISIIDDRTATFNDPKDQTKKFFNFERKRENGYVIFYVSTEQGNNYYGNKGTYTLSKISLSGEDKAENLLSSQSKRIPITVNDKAN